jgi:hypothetical protein
MGGLDVMFQGRLARKLSSLESAETIDVVTVIVDVS